VSGLSRTGKVRLKADTTYATRRRYLKTTSTQ